MINELLEKLAVDIEKAEKENIFIKDAKKIDPPITVQSVRIEVVGFNKIPGKCKYVAVRPVGENPENKTYLGILLGECSIMARSVYNIEKQEIFVKDRLNPMIFVPDLMKVVLGVESWWDTIDKPEDLKQITDVDIQNVWYVKALREMTQDEKNIPET
ncbi:MAG: hypothetical protein V1854_00290 [Methanobacteriota archaeon]